MKKYYTIQFPCDNSPKTITRERLAYLLRAARSRKGKNNTWINASGYYIWDAQASIAIKQ
jgi:hypothetical protein